jgi:hypothetical protein
LGADGLRARLDSFKFYTGEGNILSMARAGFCGTNYTSIIECKKCGACFHDLRENNDPIILHYLSNSKCLHLKEKKIAVKSVQAIKMFNHTV